MKSAIYKFLIIITICLTAAFSAHARQINLHGRVTSRGTGEPLPSVYIFNALTGKVYGYTNDEGKYMINADDNDTLEFSTMGYQTQKIPIRGQLNLDVQMVSEAKELGEVVVQAKRSTSSIITEPTDLDVIGNYIHVKTHVKVPHQIFSSARRLVIQPMIYNVTRKQVNFLTPIVYDGWRYHTTQDRMLDFDLSRDPLSKYADVKSSSTRIDNVIHIIDSLWIDDPHDDFRMDLYSSIESYDKIIYDKTNTIARGTINPLRFLEGNLQGFMVTDSMYLPAPDLQLRDTRGDVNLTFRVGKSDLDLDLGDNRKEMDNLLSQLHAIEDDPNCMIRSIVIEGTASPEGSKRANEALAKKRIESAMGFVLRNLENSTVTNAELHTNAKVEKWERVVEMLEQDSLMEEAEQIRHIIETVPDDDRSRSQAVARLPIFKMLKDEYLPRLRRVGYQFVSSRYRFLTDPEIAELYQQDPSKLSRYEFWRLYTLADSIAEKEVIAEKAMKYHPTFLVGANDLTTLQMTHGKYDSSMLAPLVKKAGDRVPDEARGTLAAVFFNEGNFLAADSMMMELPRDPKFRRIEIYTMARNGRYAEVLQELSEESPFTEVLLLLAIKANQQAWEKAQKLGDSAKEEYIKAVAANRVDNYLKAIEHLDNAFALDPSLKAIARTDGDIIDLLEDYDDDEEEETGEDSSGESAPAESSSTESSTGESSSGE